MMMLTTKRDCPDCGTRLYLKNGGKYWYVCIECGWKILASEIEEDELKRRKNGGR